MLNTIESAHGMARQVWRAGRMLADAQMVASLRLLGLAGGWSMPHDEPVRMALEKPPALFESAIAAVFTAMSGYGPERVLGAMIDPYASRTGANRARLEARGPRLPVPVPILATPVFGDTLR